MTDSEVASATYTIAEPGPSIVGEWLIDQTWQLYTDNIPIDTWYVIQNMTVIMNADETFTASGTTQWPQAAICNVACYYLKT